MDIALHLHRTPDDPLLVYPVAVILKGDSLAIGDIAFLAPKPQTLKRSAMAIYVGQIAGDEEANLLAFPAHHPHQHALAGRLS
ncbi:hypothetical protein N8E89_00405 [Phyllobacterium sp. A18/5-2]|uniref:hypothetical protein n=1 Tax=Phyllobacterium sp. A18/5-2 TaxID=2978392 RepID=UPI0021CA3B51|nr:hypothetical protein [Phyllobacterium sp. A18/5-2]UXN64388.1 hypothetical protein N8E89_00405 [Phyllobacterium sp. A18/5-2]